LPVFSRSWRIGVGSTNTLPGPGRSVFEIELAVSRDNVLRLLGRVGVPAEPLARLDLVDNGR
jgi:hypothetical protein